MCGREMACDQCKVRSNAVFSYAGVAAEGALALGLGGRDVVEESAAERFGLTLASTNDRRCFREDVEHIVSWPAVLGQWLPGFWRLAHRFVLDHERVVRGVAYGLPLPTIGHPVILFGNDVARLAR